jgi:hypothetical protein
MLVTGLVIRTGSRHNLGELYRPVTSYESTESVDSVRFFVKKFKTGIKTSTLEKQILNEIYSISDEG